MSVHRRAGIPVAASICVADSHLGCVPLVGTRWASYSSRVIVSQPSGTWIVIVSTAATTAWRPLQSSEHESADQALAAATVVEQIQKETVAGTRRDMMLSHKQRAIEEKSRA